MLELGQYKENFHEAGYEIEADMENLKRLNEKDLREMGISKRGIFLILDYLWSALFHAL